MEAFALARRDTCGLPPPGGHGTYSLLPAYMEHAARDVALLSACILSPRPIMGLMAVAATVSQDRI
ncbi:MAG: hypothetical protein JO139_01985 [Alphaproteobacteria bacterium]|nr:hypothetical protein [Alphaproteobacteria bacterium]